MYLTASGILPIIMCSAIDQDEVLISFGCLDLTPISRSKRQFVYFLGCILD